MDILADHAVLVQTSKGQAELARSDASTLDLASRALLFSLDGTADVAAMLRRAQSIERARHRLLELVRQGYAKQVFEAAPAPAVDLDAISRSATTFLYAQLGPDATELSLSVEQAETTQALAVALGRCHAVVLRLCGRERAQQFRAMTLARLGQQ
jgi:hypothetical protein